MNDTTKTERLFDGPPCPICGKPTTDIRYGSDSPLYLCTNYAVQEQLGGRVCPNTKIYMLRDGTLVEHQEDIA